MVARERSLLFTLALSLSLSATACRGEPSSDIRPENSSLPPDQRGPLAANLDRPAPPGHGPTAPATAETWNAAEIDWQPYEAGLARAKAQNKPVCLVFYTGWCPHCRAYSHVFEDPKVVARAKDFVMIRANADDESTLASQYTKDGGYVPRTFFLAPDGTLDADIHAPRPKFLYFFDEHNPAALLAGMDTALHKLVK
jgi:thiol-disulfide isomerase/thioredoxin